MSAKIQSKNHLEVSFHLLAVPNLNKFFEFSIV